MLGSCLGSREKHLPEVKQSLMEERWFSAFLKLLIFRLGRVTDQFRKRLEPDWSSDSITQYVFSVSS